MQSYTQELQSLDGKVTIPQAALCTSIKNWMAMWHQVKCTVHKLESFCKWDNSENHSYIVYKALSAGGPVALWLEGVIACPLTTT